MCFHDFILSFVELSAILLINFIIASDKEEIKKLFIKEALLMRRALSLCASLASAEHRLEAAFFEAVRTMVVRLSRNRDKSEKFSEKLPEARTDSRNQK